MPSAVDPNALLARAVALHQSGKLHKAIAIYRQLIAHFPASAKLLFLLGSAEAQGGNAAEAVRLLEQSLLVDPTSADAYNNLGLALEALERHDEALEHYDRAMALQPRGTEAYINKGLALRNRHRLEEALVCFERALDLDPGNHEQHNNRGNVLLDLRRPAEALQSFDRALQLKPDYAEALANRASALQALGRLGEALESAGRAVSIAPDLGEVHNIRGEVLITSRLFKEARESFHRAHALNPELEFAQSRLLYSKLLICDWSNFESQLASFEKRVLRGDQVCMPFDSLGLTGSPELQLKIAMDYVRKRLPQESVPRQVSPLAGRSKIRIGYYSSEFRDHATTRLMAELLELHDRNSFELIGIDFGPVAEDAMRSRVKASFDTFIDVRKMSDREVARLSRELGIDIAVDLKGYTADSRPGIFAERAAPIQVSYLGYPGTTGAPWIDYIIADPVVIPRGSERFYTEKIVSLPNSYQVNDRTRPVSETVFSREQLGLPRDFVYCCFNNNYKITPRMFDVWMRILKRVAGSVLWLFEDNPSAAENLRREAKERGVSPDRLVFAGRLSPAEHLSRQRAADLFLDTLPYNAHTTASDALWVGLPVLTCAGNAFAGRVAASLLAAIGLPELIAGSLEDYEANAIALATDADRLRQIRSRLEANRLASPLFDTPRFTHDIEAAFRAIHERRLTGLPPDHVRIQ